jgi:hypothetical protein
MILFESGGVVALVLFGFWIWAILDCISTDSALCRNLPKGIWLLIVLVLPDIGSIAWLLLGRPEKARWRPGSSDYSAPRRPVGIEDHPRYSAAAGVTDRKSAELDAQLDRWEADQSKEREAELDRREAKVRRRELEVRERELERRERNLNDD